MFGSFVLVFGTSVGSIAALITSIATLVTVMRTTKKVQEVHVLVNQRMTDVLARVEQLTGALENEGKEVPPDPADPRN